MKVTILDISTQIEVDIKTESSIVDTAKFLKEITDLGYKNGIAPENIKVIKAILDVSVNKICVPEKDYTGEQHQLMDAGLLEVDVANCRDYNKTIEDNITKRFGLYGEQTGYEYYSNIADGVIFPKAID